MVLFIGVSFPHGFLEHPSRPASRLPGARAGAARERMARHTLAAGGRRCGRRFRFGVAVSISFSGFRLFRFIPLMTANFGGGGERRAREGSNATRRYDTGVMAHS